MAGDGKVSAPPKPATTSSKPKGERTFLTNAQKLQLREFWAANAQLHVQDVADWVRRRFGASVGRATLYRIGHAPASAFEGKRSSRKKSRRVKFPDLERDVLAFCLACKQQRRALPDDLLLQKAGELRARHGISSDALKLSNGWLHSFKERHSLRAAVHATGDNTSGKAIGGPPTSADNTMPTASMVAPASIAHIMSPTPLLETAKRRRKPRVQVPKQPPEPEPVAAPPTDQQQLQGPVVPCGVTPLTYISVKALISVQAVSFLNWERVSGMRDGDLFVVVDDGVCVHRGGMYQINVDLNYSGSTPDTSSTAAGGDASIIFKVWRGVSVLLGECSARLQQENGVSLSAFQLQAPLPANAVVRIQFVAPGFALHSSRLVIKLVAAASGTADPPSTALML